MAFGDLVKSLVVRFTSENFEIVKAEIDDIPDEKTVSVKMDDSGLSAAISDIGRRMELALGNAGNDGGKSFLSGFASSLSGTPFSGLQGILSTPVVGPIVLAGLAAAAAALVTEILGVVSGFTAAAGGVVAFGALAYPTFSTISGAITQIATDTTAYQNATTAAAKSTALAKIKADWAALDPFQKSAVKDVQRLQTEFDKLAAKFEPLLAPLLNTVLGPNGIASKLMNDLVPFADIAAKAFAPLLKEFSNFLSSPGAKQFMSSMQQIEKLALPAIGHGIGQLAGAIGKLLTTMSAKDDARAIALLFDAVAGAVDFIAASIHRLMTAWDWLSQKAWPAMKHAFDNFSHASDNIIHAVDNVVHAFGNIIHAGGNVVHAIADIIGAFNHAIDNVRHFIAVAGSDISHFFTVQIPLWISEGVHWFAQLPGKIISALSGLAGMLFKAGVSAIQGLINGIKSMMGGVGGVMHAVMSVVGSFLPGSPAKTGPLSGDGWSYVRGQHFATDFGAGMLSRSSAVAAAARGVATAAGLNASGSGHLGGAGGPVQVVLEFRGADQALVTALKKIIRVRGGNPAVIGR